MNIAQMRLALSTILAFASFCLAQSTTLDDADPSITYTGTWHHDSTGANYLSSGTQSWTNDPSATLAFTFDGTGFDLCAGLKEDRGSFSWSIDGVASGTGTEQGGSMTEGVCSNVASVRNLASGNHDVVISNTGSTYFAVDTINVFTDGPILATSAATSSAVPRSRSTSSFSMSPLPASSSSAIAKATISAANRTVAKDQAQNESHSNKAAVIGGSVAGGIVAAILAAVGFWLFRRRQNRDRDSMLYPDASSSSARDLDEKNFEWNEKRPLSTAAGPAGGLPRSQGVSNLHKRNISRQDSLESMSSEPFQPETLRNAPAVEPYYPAQFTPSHSVSHSLSSIGKGSDLAPVFNSPPRAVNRNIAHPFDVAPLRTKSSYDDRLAAASAGLPDWQPNQPIPRANFLRPAFNQERVISDASSAYPATECPRESRMERHSAAYSGMEDEEDEAFQDYSAYEQSQVGSNSRS